MLQAPPEEVLRPALDAGARFFQYRNKRGTRKAIYETSLRLAEACGRSGAIFVVNDHADIAVAVGAAGVHLGQDDLPISSARKIVGDRKIIGISTHSREQAKEAEAAGADYIGFGPIFATSTKDAGAVQGVGAVTAIRQVVSIPIVAIGGINLSNVGDVLKAGADGVAVISAILRASDVRSTTASFVKIASEQSMRRK